MTQSPEHLAIGKMYKVTSYYGIEAYPYTKDFTSQHVDFRYWPSFSDLEIIGPGAVFVYIGLIKINQFLFSKILVDDKLYITYNSYYKLNERYVETYE